MPLDHIRMRHRKIAATEQVFVERVREIEERLFADQLDTANPSYMKSGGRYFWHFRPSHHFATGLITQEDITLLSQPDKRLLSIGAHPAFLERTLLELGVPPENIYLADKDPAIAQCAKPMQSVTFDINDEWPNMGTFDRIIFPESLCIAIGEKMGKKGKILDLQAKDTQEAQLLSGVMRQALERLRPGGIIRANGPMSHPNVIRAMRANLEEAGHRLDIESRRFFLTVRPKQ